MRSLFRHTEWPRLRPPQRFPLLPSFLPDYLASFRSPAIHPQRRILLAVPLHLELHPAFVPQQSPFL